MGARFVAIHPQKKLYMSYGLPTGEIKLRRMFSSETEAETVVNLHNGDGWEVIEYISHQTLMNAIDDFVRSAQDVNDCEFEHFRDELIRLQRLFERLHFMRDRNGDMIN